METRRENRIYYATILSFGDSNGIYNTFDRRQVVL